MLKQNETFSGGTYRPLGSTTECNFNEAEQLYLLLLLLVVVIGYFTPGFLNNIQDELVPAPYVFTFAHLLVCSPCDALTRKG